MTNPIRRLALSLLLGLSLVSGMDSSIAGERMGNGGDPRRFRVHRSLYYLWEVLMESDSSRVRGEGADWLFARRRWFMDSLAGATIEWVDRQPDGSGRCLRATRPTQEGVHLRFSYADCPSGMHRTYFADEIAHALFGPFATETYIGEIVRAVHQIADETRAARPGYPHRRMSIPREDLAEAGRMAEHFAAARELAFDAVSRNGPSHYAFYEFKLRRRVVALLRERERDLIQEVDHATARWRSDALSCATTENRPGAPIEVALGECYDIRSVGDLAWMIVHESVHHLGVEDETLADAVATAFLSTGDWYSIE